MEEIYLLVSDDNFTIQKKIEKLFKKEEQAEIIRYDLKEASLDSVIEDLDTLNFFTNKKIVIAENAYFLTSEKPKNAIEQNIEVLEKYLKNPNPDNVLVLVCSKLDERKSLVKNLKKQAKIIDTEVDIMKQIDEELENYQMDVETRRYLIDRTLNNYERTINEIGKLKLFKGEDKKITKEDIDALVIKTVDDNVFTLIDAIIKKDKTLAFEIYEDMILHNEEPMKIMILLANKLRLLYQVKILSKTIYKDEEIGKIIGSHPYPVKLARAMTKDFKEKDLLHYLDRLAHIDIDIKMGKTYQNIAFETFIMSL